jgi:hypothetical protein
VCEYELNSITFHFGECEKEGAVVPQLIVRKLLQEIEFYKVELLQFPSHISHLPHSACRCMAN